MTRKKNWATVAALVLVFTACKKNEGGNNNYYGNHVYTISNAEKGNRLIDYRRSPSGMLTPDSSYATNGLGTGRGLGSQGAVTIAGNGTVLAVNAGSNTISSFRPTSRGLVLQSAVNSGGEMPISITEYNNVVFVLNAGGKGNIAGFNLSANGQLTAIANAGRPLSSSNAGPAQISFVNNGSVLVVTEKVSNSITSYTTSGAMRTVASANTTPFGFAADSYGNIYVSEAAGGAANASTVSSYHVDAGGGIKLISGPVSAKQTAACWVVITNNEKRIYVSNTGSNNMSLFYIDHNSAKISISKAVAANTGTAPGDAALSADSKFLYVLTAASNTINCFKINPDNGELTNIQTVSNIAGTDAGLAAN